jgi:hypothetical protein
MPWLKGATARERQTVLAGLECEGKKTVLVFLVDERTGGGGRCLLSTCSTWYLLEGSVILE